MSADSDRDLGVARDASFTWGHDVVSHTVLEDLERQYFSVREERDRLEHALVETKEKLVDDAEGTIRRLQNELEKEVDNNTVAYSKIQNLEESINSAQERVDRSQVENDNLRQELSRLSQQNSDFTKKILSLEGQTQLKDSEAIPLFHETQRLRTELDSLQAHSNWLEKELEQKSDVYNRQQKESRDQSLQLHMRLEQATNEKKIAEVTLQSVKQVETELQEKVGQLSHDLLAVKHELSAVQENSEDQLREERRIVQSQKEYLERWQQRYNDVVRQNEGMKEGAARAMEAHEEEISRVRLDLEAEFNQLLEKERAEYEKKLDVLNRSSVAVTTLANTIAMATGEDGEDDEDNDEPMSLTDLYTKLEETKQALGREKLLCTHFQQQFKQVKEDILDAHPKMQRQREEYELAVDKMNDYEQRLRQAILDRDSAREEARDAQEEVSSMRLALATKKGESEELAKQVQGLLISRAGGQVDDDIPLSIQHMQSQNQRMLAEQQRLSFVIQDLERKLDTDNLRRKLEEQELELSTLRQEQRNQESLVEKIAMHRDLYKALHASNESSIFGSFQDETNTLSVIKQQSDRSRILEERNKELENHLVETKSNFDSALREKEGMSERIGRYETVQADLRRSIDSLEHQVVSLRGESARKSSESDYHQEKSDRLEAALERSRGEISSITKAKDDLDRMNLELQQNLSQLNSSLSQTEEDSRRNESKLRLLQTQLETSKAFEARAVEENHQLRADITRHGSVNENLRRIEAALEVKAGGEKEKLNEEVVYLSSQLQSERRKYSSEVEKLNMLVAESDERLKNLESLCSKAQTDLLKEEKASLQYKSELNALLSKCKYLESRLEIATKKLGDGAGDEDADVSLQTRVDSLTLQLETKDVELGVMVEKVEIYQKISNDSESEVIALKALTEENVTKHKRDIAELEEKVKSLSALSSSKQEVIQDLTNDLAGHRDERNEIVSKLSTEISSLKATVESRSKDSTALEEANIALNLDLESLRNEVVMAQQNYERELGLHSQARFLLRNLQEKADKGEQSRTELKGAIEILQEEVEGQREAWSKEKLSLQESLDMKEQTLKQTREQNAILHAQVEKLRALSEPNYLGIIGNDDATESQGQAGQKDILELRELVRFQRSENEHILVELDSTKRSVERERSASNVVKRNLDQARAELNALLTESHEKFEQSSEPLRKLQETEAQVKVLTDSNQLMRQEKERLQKEVLELQEGIERANDSSKPSEAVIRDLKVQLAALRAERDGLKEDLDAWKDRVQSLVSKFNQIDPEEHNQLKKTIREKEAWQKTTEEENLRIRNIAKNLNQKAREQKSLIDEKTKEVERLRAENENISNENASHSKILEEQRQELNVIVDRLRKDAASHTTQLDGANEQNNRLRETLRKFQSTIRELKDNEKKLVDQLATHKELSADHEIPFASSKLSSGLSSSKQVEPAKHLPSIPEEGFKFGPSDGQSQTQQVVVAMNSADTDASTPGKDAPSELKPQTLPATIVEPLKSKDTVPSSSNSVPETATGSSGIAVSQPIRRMSGEKKELSMKEKLIEKKQKLEEAKLRKRKLEMQANQKSQADLSEIPEKRAKTGDLARESVITPSVPKTSGADSQNDKLEAGTGIQDADKTEDNGYDANLVNKSKIVKDSTSNAAETAPETNIDDFEVFSASASRSASPVLGSSSGAPASDALLPPTSSTSQATTNSIEESQPFAPPSGSGTSFLDMKPPGSSSSVTFSFGTSTFILPTPAQPTPASSASPFNVFGSGTNPFGSFGLPGVPTSQSLFDSQFAPEKTENDEK